MHVCMCMFTCACMWVDVHFICIYMLCVAENACVNVHCVFTFECMGFYMCAHKSVYMLCMHVYVYLGVGVCVCACLYYLYVYVHVSTFIFVDMSMFACVDVRICMYASMSSCV